MYDILVQQMKDEVLRHGVRELRTPAEVDRVLQDTTGTVLVFVNSVCGCAGSIARPALRLAIQHRTQPDLVVTVFASTDHEATARAREYFTNQPPSSPSFAFIRDGKFVEMIHRSDIERSTPVNVAQKIVSLIDEHCTKGR